jgi:hypothetical protein
MGPSYVWEMHDMVKRGRNHASIIVNSLCNEIECGNLPWVGQAMVNFSKALDPTRPTTANSDSNDGLGHYIDIQGFSHASENSFVAAHKSNPKQPLVLSECCSCTTQRLPRSVNDSCMREQNAPGMDLPYVAGSLGVWTLFDYFGEPPGPWPYVSSSFGQLCLAGFPKPHAYYYTANWREAVRALPGALPLDPAPVVRVLDLLDALVTGSAHTAKVSAITSAATVELLVDGRSQGRRAGGGAVVTWAVPFPPAANCSWPTPLNGVQCKGLANTTAGAASPAACEAAACAAGAPVWQWEPTLGCWAGTPTATPCPPPAHPGRHWVGAGASGSPAPLPPPFQNATAVARDAGGAVVGAHTVIAPRNAATPAALGLYVDVPSPATGTGAKLLLDGSDVALLRAALLDGVSDALVSGAPLNVTFSIVSGPGRVAGVGAGDPAAHEQPNGATVATFGGLARALVVVTVDCTSPARDVARAVDGDAGQTTVLPEGAPCPTEDIVVAVDAPGLPRATVAISVSSDAAADGVLAAAAAGLRTAAVEYVAAFVG